MNIAWPIYRRLAAAFPHEFKLAFGSEMMQAGEDAIADVAKRHGALGLVRVIADLLVRLPIEYLSEMRRDLPYAARTLMKSPGYAVVGIISMGLGIGLTTNVYSSGWALLTRTLPGVANAEQLVTAQNPASYPYIERYREEKNLFAGVAAVQNGVQFNVAFEGRNNKPERVYGQLVSPDYFSVLGMDAQRGRLLSADLDKTGTAAPVVVSDRYWRSRLNADPDAIGQTIHLNGQPAIIVGITPRKFDGALTANPAELFVPTTVPAKLAPELGNDVLHNPSAKDFQLLFRLAPGISIDEAEAALDGVTRRLDKDDAFAPPQQDKAKRVILLPAGTRMPIPREYRPKVMGFYIALMVIITAIACLNLATMVLARAASRRKELAIRLGVGASRFRLIRQMITEGILLSLIGGAAGFAMAYGLWALTAHTRLPAGSPIGIDNSLDWHTAIFVFVLAVVCGIGFSILPALQATRTDVAPALKDGAALQFSGHRRFGLRNLAMGAQVAGSMLLLLVTGFLVLGILNGNSIRTNFSQKTMVFLSIDPVRDGYTSDKAQAFFERLPERLRNAPAVTSFALAAQPPYLPGDEDNFHLTVDDPQVSSPVQKDVAKQTVGAGYFAVLNEPVLAGREFEESDQRVNAEATVASKGLVLTLPLVLNEKAARAFFGKDNPIGKHLRGDRRAYEVVGVVPEMKDAGGMIQAIAYLPLTRHDFAQPPGGGITIIARGHSAEDALGGVRSVVSSMDPNLTLFNVQTLSEYLELIRSAMRSALRMFGGIGIFGLALSAIGLAGVTGCAVAQRRKEIGIRMALGARKSQVLGLVLRESGALIAAGTVIGFLGAVALAKALSAITTAFSDAFTVGVDDPRLLIGAPLLLAGLALLACYFPARRATKIDPLQALRQE
ncbi:MAG: ADOP family duplicated permease [Terracidiphilus sp.]|jgi:predicted permease